MATERRASFVPGPAVGELSASLVPAVDIIPYLKTPDQHIWPADVELLQLIGREPGVPVPISALKTLFKGQTHFQGQERASGDKYLRVLFSELRPKLAPTSSLHHHNGHVWLGELSETKLTPEERAIWPLKYRQFQLATVLYQNRGVPVFKEQLFTQVYHRRFKRDDPRDEDNLKQLMWELRENLTAKLGTNPIQSFTKGAYWWGVLDGKKIPDWSNFDPRIPAVTVNGKPYILSQNEHRFMKHCATTQFIPLNYETMALKLFGNTTFQSIDRVSKIISRLRGKGLPIVFLTRREHKGALAVYGWQKAEQIILPANLNPALFKAGTATVLTPEEVIMMMAFSQAKGLPLELNDLQWELTDGQTPLSTQKMTATIRGLQTKLANGLTIVDHEGGVWLQQAGATEQNKINEVFSTLVMLRRKLAVMLYKNRGLPLSREQLFFRVYGRKFRETKKDADMWRLLMWRTAGEVNQSLGQQAISPYPGEETIYYWGPVDISKIPDLNHYQAGQAVMRIGERILAFTNGERQFLEWWQINGWQRFTISQVAQALYKVNDRNSQAATRTLVHRLRKYGLPISPATYDKRTKQHYYYLSRESLWRPADWLDYKIFKDEGKVELSSSETKLLFHLLQVPGVPWEIDDLAFELSPTDLPMPLSQVNRMIDLLQAKLKPKYHISSNRGAVCWGNFSNKHLTRAEKAIWQLPKMERKLVKALYENSGIPIGVDLLLEKIYGKRGVDSRVNEDQMIRTPWCRIRKDFPEKLGKSNLHHWHTGGIYWWGKLDKEQIPTLSEYKPQIPAVKINNKVILLTQTERKFINWCFNRRFKDFTPEEAAKDLLGSTSQQAIVNIRVMKMRLARRGFPIKTVEETVAFGTTYGVYKWDLEGV